MGANTEIAWCDHTFNPWIGCVKVGPGCDHCYAEAQANRHFKDTWGLDGTYKTMAEKYWFAPLKWDRDAAKAGKRAKVFCASMADIFDNRGPESEREKVWALIRQTPNLIWILLTKRAGNIAKMLPPDLAADDRVWVVVTVVNQEEANRDIPKLQQADAAVRGISYEPGLGHIDFSMFIPYAPNNMNGVIDWVIVGGESGHGARPFNIEWARSVIAQCKPAGVAVFVKQMGARPHGLFRGVPLGLPLHDRKGGNPAEWPPDLRVRGFPAMAEERIGQLDLA